MRPARRVSRRGPLLPVTALAACLTFSSTTASVSFAAPAPLATPTSAPVWSAAGESTNDDFAYGLAAAGDVNRDGYDDVIVGVPGWGGDYNYFGRALVYLGSPAGLSPNAVWSMEGRRPDGGLGYSVAGAGDVNGDGFADVIVGEYGFDGGHRPYRGRAIIVPGSPGGPRSTRAWEVAGDLDHEYFGELVAGAGDVNGDGYDDVLVSGSNRTGLYSGGPGGIERRPAWTGPAAYRMSGAGDVNGDGYDDVLLGSLLFLGSSSGLQGEPSWTGPPAGSTAGGGDLNGDGYADIVLGAVWPYLDLVYVYAGSGSGPAPAPTWEIQESREFREFGDYVAVAGDVNADGYADLAVTDPRHSVYPLLVPSVGIYLGGPSGPSRAADWMAGKPRNGQTGMKVALGADVNGDGSSEVLVGWPQDVVGTISPGRAELYALGPGYPAPEIVHEPLWGAPLGAPVDFEAEVTDATHSVARVELLYHSYSETEYGPPVAMLPVGGDRYRGTLTPDEVGNVGIVYFIRATDDYGLSRETIPLPMDLMYPEGTALGARVEPGARGAGRISFVTRRPGPARVRLFDVQGRLVATLFNESSLAPGRHSVSLETMPGAAGVLFYRVETPDGTWSGKLVRLR